LRRRRRRRRRRRALENIESNIRLSLNTSVEEVCKKNMILGPLARVGARTLYCFVFVVTGPPVGSVERIIRLCGTPFSR